MARGQKLFKVVQKPNPYFIIDDEAYCPLCMRNKKDKERHHVIWAAEGGTDDPINILDICRSCHAVLTKGDSSELFIYDYAAWFIQLSRYGLRWLWYCRKVCKYKDDRARVNELVTVALSSMQTMTRDEVHRSLCNSGAGISMKCILAIRDGYESVEHAHKNWKQLVQSNTFDWKRFRAIDQC